MPAASSRHKEDKRRSKSSDPKLEAGGSGNMAGKITPLEPLKGILKKNVSVLSFYECKIILSVFYNVFFLSCQPENPALANIKFALESVGISPTLPANPLDSTDQGADDRSETNESESITSAAALKLQPEVFLFLF